MTINTIKPNGSTQFVGGGSLLIQPGTSTVHAVLADANQSTYINLYGGAGVVLDFDTFAMPAGAVIRSITNRVTANASSNAVLSFTRYGSAVNGAFALNTNGAWLDYSNQYSDYGGAQPATQADIDGYQLYIVETAATSAYVATVSVDVDWVAAPSATITAPTNNSTITTTNAPALSWTFSPGAAGATQAAYQYKIFTQAQYTAGGFDPASSTATYDSGVVASSVSSAAILALPTGVTYRVYLRVAQVTNGSLHWSPTYASTTFTINITPPVLSSVVATPSSADASITGTATWSNTSLAWETYDVQTTYDGGTTWLPVRGYTNKIVPIPAQVLVLTEPFDSLAAWTLVGTAGAPAIAAGGKVGNYLKMGPTAADRGYLLPVASRGDYVDVSFWWRASLVTIAPWKLLTVASGTTNPATQYELSVYADAGKLTVSNLVTTWTSTGTVAINTWYRVRLVAHLGVSGTIRLDLDGTTVLNLSDVQAFAHTPTIQSVWLSNSSGNNNDFDELSLSTATTAPMVPFTDYEAPNGTTTQYRARATRITGGLPITGAWTLSNTVAWSDNSPCSIWLKDPAHPSSNMKLDAQMPDVLRDRVQGVFRPIGAKYPIVVSDVLQAGQSTITIVTRSDADATRLASVAAGGPLLLQTPPSAGWQWGSRYVAPGALQETHTTPGRLSQTRVWTLGLTEVARPPDDGIGV